MPYQKPGHTYTRVGLRDNSDELADLDELATIFSCSRADAYRLLAIAYSRAKRGAWQPLWAFVSGLSLPAHLLLGNAMQNASAPSTEPQEDQTQSAQQEAANQRKKKLAKFYQKS